MASRRPRPSSRRREADFPGAGGGDGQPAAGSPGAPAAGRPSSRGGGPRRRDDRDRYDNDGSVFVIDMDDDAGTLGRSLKPDFLIFRKNKVFCIYKKSRRNYKKQLLNVR